MRGQQADEYGPALMHAGVVTGDTLTVAAQEGYRKIVNKVLAGFAWALEFASFDVLVKTDDDSTVDIKNLWSWISMRRPRVMWEYAGRPHSHNPVVRSTMTRASVSKLAGFELPADFHKWDVPYEVSTLPHNRATLVCTHATM